MIDYNPEWIKSCVCVAAAQEGDSAAKRRTLISSYFLTVTVWGGKAEMALERFGQSPKELRPVQVAAATAPV